VFNRAAAAPFGFRPPILARYAYQPRKDAPPASASIASIARDPKVPSIRVARRRMAAPPIISPASSELSGHQKVPSSERTL
jgi:hypothetical protein